MPRNPFYRWPIPMLLLGLALCAPLVWQLRNISIGTDARTLLQGDQRNLASFEKVMEILPDNVVLVVSLKVGDIFTPNGIRDVALVSEALRKCPGLIDVKSLTHSSKPVRQGLSFSLVPLVPGMPNPTQAQLDGLRDYCMGNALIRNVIVAPDGQHTLITATFQRDVSTPELRHSFAADVDAALAPFREQGIEFQAISLPMVESEVFGTLQADVRRFAPIAGVVTLVLLLVFLRSPVAVFLILVLQAIGLALVPGLIRLVGQELSVFNLLLLPVVAGVHLTLLVHTVGNVLRFRKSEPDSEPVARMLGATFRPCLFAALTTAAGLLSLLLSDLPIVRQVGLLGAIAVLAVFLLTFGPGVSLLRILYGRGGKTDGFGVGEQLGESPQSNALSISPGAGRHADRTRLFRLPILLGGACVLVASLIGLTFIRTDIRAVEFVKPSSPSRQAVEHFDSVYGGVNVVEINFDTGTPSGINKLPFLRYLESLQAFAEQQTGVSGVYSYAQLLSMMNQVWEGEKPGSNQLPNSGMKISMFVIGLKSQNFPFLDALCDAPMQTARLVVRTPDMPTDDYLAIVNRVLAHAEETAPEGVTVSAKEGIHAIVEAERSVLRSQVRTAVVTILGIGLVLTLLWRSPRLAMVALAVNLIPVVLVLGLAGYLNIPLNAISVMVAAVAFGISVDDSVHFLTSFLGHRRAGLSKRDAVAAALTTKTRPIILTSLILTGIFATFLTFSFPPVIHFGLLCAVAFLAAMVTSLWVLPALVGSEKAQGFLSKTGQPPQTTP